MWRLLTPLLTLALVSPAAAHSRLTSPVPRNDFDDIKDTNALHPPPCGGPRSTVVMAQPVGNSIKVEWDETVDHPGHYEIMFAMANDANFAFLTDPAGVTLNNITDVQGGALPHHYTQMVKLPSAPCGACTLQVKQFMEGAGYYMSCADVQLTAAATLPDAGAMPAPIVVITDGGAPDDLAQPTAAADPASTAPSTPPATDEPAAAPPDLAAGPIGPTKYDYSYGCSSAPGAPSEGALPLLLFVVALVVCYRRAHEHSAGPAVR
jgi:MYXO-CTERM domain-containing protein